jgi:tetratricopeptide (TPR) repeat protein
MTVGSHVGQHYQVSRARIYLGKTGAPLLLPVLSLLALLVVKAPWWAVGTVLAGYLGGILPLLALQLRDRHRRYWHATSMPLSGRDPGSSVPWAAASSEAIIGRYRELQVIGSFLERRGGATRPPTVIIKGAPGTGKASLAAQAALRVSEAYPDGQIFVQFDARLEPTQAAQAALGGLVADLRGSKNILPYSYEELERAFIAATLDKSLIIIADGITDPRLTRSLMKAGPDCLIFITTERLAGSTDHAMEVQLKALDRSDALQVLAARIGQERIKEEQGAAEKIIIAAGLNPLAIRLVGTAIAESPYWSLGVAYERIIQRTRVGLDSGEQGSQPQSDALSVALEICYNRLAEDARTAVSLLALLETPVFAPWMLAALLEARPEPSLMIIDSLLRAGLLERVSSDATGVPLFRVRQQVLNFAERKLLASSDKHYREEHRARLAQAREKRHGAELSRSATGAILLIQESGDFTTALAQARDAIALARDKADRPREALALAALAEIQAELGYTGEADELAEGALHIGGRDSRPRALRVLGKVRRRWRQLDAADKYLREALQLADDNHDSPEKVRILRELAAVQAEGPDRQAALRTAEEAIEEAQFHQDTMPLLMAGARWVEGRILRRLGRYEQSAHQLKLALQDSVLSRQRMWQAWIERELGLAEFERGNLPLAQVHAHNSLDLFAEMRHRYGVAYCRLLLGQIYLADQHLNNASRMLTEAYDTFQNCGDPWIEAEASRMLAKVRAQQDQSRAANRLLDNAAATFSDLADLSSLDRVRRDRAAGLWRRTGRIWSLAKSKVSPILCARR